MKHAQRAKGQTGMMYNKATSIKVGKENINIKDLRCSNSRSTEWLTSLKNK